MKKVLNIISQYPGKTGSGTYLQAFMHEGSKKGYVQGLIAALSLGDIYDNKCVDNLYPVVFNSNNLNFPIVGMSDQMPYVSTKYSEMTEGMMTKWKKEFEITIKKAVNDFKPDLIITHHLWLSTAIAATLYSDIKTIGICHGTDIRQLLNNPKYKDEVINGCKNLDLILSLSRIQKLEIENMYNINSNKIKVVGGGYKEEYFYMSDDLTCNKKIRLVYAGKLSRSKGVISLIKAFKEIEGNYDIELLIAGAGVGKEENYIKQIGDNVSIHFLGHISQEKLGQTFRDSDIFIMPSFYEGLSLVTLEALASGLLVVANEIPGLTSFLPGELIQKGIVEFVPLPTMVGIDLPLDSSLRDYEIMLKEAIVKQIERCKEGLRSQENSFTSIEDKSWKNIFGEIESHI